MGPEISLGASGGPHGSPKGPQGPLEAHGCHLGGFGGHLGVIFEAKSKPKSMTEFIFFRMWCWILVYFGVHVYDDFCSFFGACNDGSRNI